MAPYVCPEPRAGSFVLPTLRSSECDTHSARDDRQEQCDQDAGVFGNEQEQRYFGVGPKYKQHQGNGEESHFLVLRKESSVFNLQEEGREEWTNE